MNTPLYASTAVKISPANLDKEMELFPAVEVVWERIMSLASLARSIDPSLGDHVRFVKRAPRDANRRNAVDFDVLLTHSTRPSVSLAESTAQRQPDHAQPDFTLEQALRRVLPAEVVDHELGLLSHAPNFGLNSGVSAAIQQAFLKGNVFFHTEGIPAEAGTSGSTHVSLPASTFGDLDLDLDDANGSSPEVFVSSSPVKVSDVAFMRHPTVARWVWISQSSSQSAQDDRIPPAVNSIRKDVLFLRSTLAKPFFETSALERQKVVETITRLNEKRFLSGTFEEAYDHGWIGYVAAARPVKAGDKIPRQLSSSSQWVKFLLENKIANVNVPYAEHRPAVIALVKNQGNLLNTLLDSGLSANTYLDRYPALLNRKYQRQLDARNESSIPLLLVATVMGAKQSATALLHNGADPDQRSDQGVSPLDVAASQGSVDWATFLLNHGANPAATSPQGDHAEDFVPEDQDFLYGLLKQARLTKDQGLPLPKYDDFGHSASSLAPEGLPASPRGPR